MISRPCNVCRGSGYEAGEVTIDVAIPAGVDNDMRVFDPHAEFLLDMRDHRETISKQKHLRVPK